MAEDPKPGMDNEEPRQAKDTSAIFNTQTRNAGDCKEELQQPIDAVETYRCPYCFAQLPSREMLEAHLALEYAYRGIALPPIPIQGPRSTKETLQMVANLWNQKGAVDNANYKIQQFLHTSSNLPVHVQNKLMVNKPKQVWEGKGLGLELKESQEQLAYKKVNEYLKASQISSKMGKGLGSYLEQATGRLLQEVNAPAPAPFPVSMAMPPTANNPVAIDNNPKMGVTLAGVLPQQGGLGGGMGAGGGPGPGALGLESVNWCAHCCTSFRLTSDLVQHMRNFHRSGSREPGSGPGPGSSSSLGGGMSAGSHTGSKQLECPTCGELFKERHHLTRHLSSHTMPINSHGKRSVPDFKRPTSPIPTKRRSEESP